MQSLVLIFVCAALLIGGPARASDSTPLDTPKPDAPPARHSVTEGRVGILPESWVETLEANSISEQSALYLGGATAVAIGVGAYAGVASGGAVGGVLTGLWIAHLPFHVALFGGGGYAAWLYFWPNDGGVDLPSGERISVSFQPPVR